MNSDIQQLLPYLFLLVVVISRRTQQWNVCMHAFSQLFVKSCFFSSVKLLYFVLIHTFFKAFFFKIFFFLPVLRGLLAEKMPS